MEPGCGRDCSASSGAPQAACMREETPGKEGSGTVSKRREEVSQAGQEEEEARGGEPPKTADEEGKYEEELDPRIQEELEHLNQASDEINKLELQLDDARSSYRRILTDSARKLNAQGSALGACIEKARPYYEARRLAKEVSHDTRTRSDWPRR
uniref:SH3 domain-binding protein 5 n=1 Tax=Knipowitschia caucasica TaxID=637954 RepID=A0AAV2K4Z5_KNICA